MGNNKPELKVILTEEITWKVSKPDHFPCFICREGEATMRTTVKKEDVVFILSVCEGCNEYGKIEGFINGEGR